MSKRPISKQYPRAVVDALAHTFNSTTVSALSHLEYRQYIEAVAALTLGTLIKNQGRRYVKDFCQAALNTKEPQPIAQQVKRH